MKKFFTRLTFFFFAVLFLTSSCSVFAKIDEKTLLDNKTETGIVLKKAFGDKIELVNIVANIIGVVLGLLGVVLVIVIIWSGFEYMTAGGEAEKARKARRRLINACIGAAIVILAGAISYGVMLLITSNIANPSPE